MPRTTQTTRRTRPRTDPTPSRAERADLRRLAEACNIHTAYHSGLTGLTKATDQALTLALRAWGVDVSGPHDAARALRGVLAARATRRLDPVVVAWTRSRPTALLRLPTPRSPGRARIEIVTEPGETLSHAVDLADLAPITKRQPDASTATFVRLPLTAPGVRLAMGYHQLRVIHARVTFDALLIVAPKVSYQTPARTLGVFAPTYALRSRTNPGVGNLSDLGRLGAWAADRGAPVLGTLPLLACFLDDSPLYQPSPYAPVSRLFFNELFLDPRRAPGFASCAQAQHILASARHERAAKALRDQRTLVDYRASYGLVRPVLDALAGSFFTTNADRTPEFRAFLAENPQARAYANFRAACERRGRPWTEWPARMQAGKLGKGDFSSSHARTHLYAQFALRTQLAELADALASRGGGLYLDLAVGANADGYDAWANPDLFMPGTSVGSPPDTTYTEGQDWGFPPMHPERAREEGYAYYIDSLRAQMRVAGALRLDHVMALHRLFTIAAGHGASEGVYVGYREDEMFAILSLESHRNRCRVFGENLGTVPAQIERAMSRHRVGKMWIGSWAMPRKQGGDVNTIEANCVASLNTHDMPPIVTFLDAGDVPTRVKLGVFRAELAAGERAGREQVRKPTTAFLRKHGLLPKRGKADPAAIGRGLNRYIASSEAELALVNIEDLWGERHLQNVPGTSDEHPNWRHKLAKTLDQIERDADLGGFVEELAERRAEPAIGVTKPAPARKKASKKTKRRTMRR